MLTVSVYRSVFVCARPHNTHQHAPTHTSNTHTTHMHAGACVGVCMCVCVVCVLGKSVLRARSTLTFHHPEQSLLHKLHWLDHVIRVGVFSVSVSLKRALFNETLTLNTPTLIT